MNWAIITPWEISPKSIGGTERYVKDLANSLIKKNHNVTVYMLSGKSYSLGKIKFISLDILGEGVIVDEYVLQKKFGDLICEEKYDEIARFLEKFIDVTKYDILQLNSHIFLKCWQEKQRIFTLHSNSKEFVVTGTMKEFKIQEEIMKKQADLGMKFVVPSKCYLKYWKSKLGKNVHSIPHAIDPSRLVCQQSKNDILKKYNLEKNKINIILPSRLESIQKRPLYYLKACAKLPDILKENIQIVLTGIDSQYEPYVNVLSKYSNNHCLNTKFVKFDNIVEGYKLSDIVVVPSRSETFGYSALEGLTLGKITILTKIPTLKELANGNSQAYLFSSLNELVEIMKDIVINKKFKTIKPNKNWIKRFDIDTWCEKYIELFK